MTHTKTVDVESAEHNDGSMLQPEKMVVETDGAGTVKVANQDVTGNPDVYDEIKSAWENGELDKIEVTVHSTDLTPDSQVSINGVA